MLIKVRTQHKGKFDPDHENHCIVCREYGWVDIDGYCSEHSHVLGMNVISNQLLCPTCANLAKLICIQCNRGVDAVTESGKCYACEYIEENSFVDLRLRECWGCGKHKMLNRAGLCTECEINDKLRQAGKSPLAYCTNCSSILGTPLEICRSCGQRKCVDCQAVFTPHVTDQFQCDDCLPKCKGCSSKFVSLWRSDSFCPECQDKQIKGQCPKCEERAILAPEGLCYSCLNLVEDTELQWCRNCHDNLAKDSTKLCKYCTDEVQMCPLCATNLVSNTEIICQNCRLQKT
jgi:hypothetical protein